MPKQLEQKLRRQARKKGMTEETSNAYVYGTMRNMGWKPKQEKK